MKDPLANILDKDAFALSFNSIRRPDELKPLADLPDPIQRGNTDIEASSRWTYADPQP